ncbi:glycosyltransferase [Paludisphaera rhizosphaerae]|uniref:glycosyltransferase n=1 Tax=Paludisphaera rhizosphaerae TaxID=2711216 RepID=UPI0013EB5CB6|nr:glycosyltransferase [Paludisphaera rhizosphaerae]
MLKVLQLIPTLDRSGAEKQMVMLSKDLPRDRFTVEAAVLTRSGPLEAELTAAGVPVTSIAKRHKVDPWALGRLTRFIEAGKFDVVQTWIFAANAYGRIAAKRAKVPVVVTAEMAVDLWKGPIERYVDRKLATSCDRLVGNSNAVVDFYMGMGLPADRMEMIYSGIADEPPPADVDPAAVKTEIGFPPDASLALFAGRLAPQKRVADLLKTLDLLQHVQPDLRTAIVGDGPLRSTLEKLAVQYELSEKVRFLGHRDDIQRLMAASDVVVLPSEYEGLPNVVLEAMMLSKPVVATAAPGTTEVVVDGVTGLLAPVGNLPLLARGLRDLIRDPRRARALGAAGRERALADFRADAMVARFADLYERLAAAKGLRVVPSRSAAT